MSDSEVEGGVPLIEAEFDTTASSKKRKAEAEPEDIKDSKKAAKKAKRKEKKKLKAKEIDEDDLDQGEFFLYTGSSGRDLSGNKRTNKVCCSASCMCTWRQVALLSCYLVLCLHP